jgi:hypothetical protein
MPSYQHILQRITVGGEKYFGSIVTKILLKVKTPTDVLTLFPQSKYSGVPVECRCFSQEKLCFADFRCSF